MNAEGRIHHSQFSIQTQYLPSPEEVILRRIPRIPPMALEPISPLAGSFSKDQVLLEGPHSRWKELRLLTNVMFEFIRGFRALHFAGPCVTVFGSARFKEGSPYYEQAREMGKRIVGLGFTVMTGGGPGIMEGANRGAHEAGGRSVACNIKLPMEQKPNPYLDKFVTLEHFFVRKVMLFKYSYAFVAMPGGAGTMDEFFEAVTLMQTKKLKNFPVILWGTDYWGPLLSFFMDMVKLGTIDASELNMLLVTDSMDEAIAHLQSHAAEAYHLRKRQMPRPSPLFGERAIDRDWGDTGGITG
jgi:uncharacterized protein (TIGR00730 family)